MISWSNSPSGCECLRCCAQYPPPDRRRVERALSAMRTRRARLRRYRIIGVSGVLAVLIAALGAVYAGASSDAGRGIHVEGGTSTTVISAPDSTEAPEPAPTAPTTMTTPTTAEPTTSTSASTSTSTTVTVPGTEVITYQPFAVTGAIDPTLRVVAQASGTCLNGESSRSYRCFGGSGGIYDPCFAAPGGTSQPLVCPNDPATNDVTTFAATSVTADHLSGVVRAWAIQLSGGQICRFETGASTGLGPFSCGTYGSPSAIADCLEPQSSRPWWTTECQRQESTTSPLAPYQVTKVWF
jgi:hypothetical protein